MAFPIPTKVNGNVLYSTDLTKILWAGVPPNSGSVAIEGGRIGSCILIMADYSLGINSLQGQGSGCAYLQVGSTEANLPIVRSQAKGYTGNPSVENQSDTFTLRYFTSGLTWSTSVWIKMATSNWQNFTGANDYLTILGV